MEQTETIQQQPPSRLRKVYDYLKQNNKVRSETYEDFEEKMQDPARLEKVYNYLKEQNKVRADSFDAFQDKMGLKKKENGLPGRIPLAAEENPQTLQAPTDQPQVSGEISSPVLDSGLTEEQERERNLAELAKEPVASESQAPETKPFVPFVTGPDTYAPIARAKDAAIMASPPRQETPEQKAAREDFEKNKERNPLVSIGKSIWNIAANVIPQTAAAALATVAKGSMLAQMPETLPPGTSYPTIEETQQQAKGVKSALIQYANEQNAEGSEYMKYVVNSMDKISDPIDALNYVFAAAGNAAGQIPLSVATAGGSSIMQEVGSIYLTSVNKIAQEKGLTVEQVINQNLDEPGFALAYGAAAGILDRFSAGKVMGAFNQQALKQAMRSRALSAVGSAAFEGGTEYAQSWLEQIGASQASPERSFTDAIQEVSSSPQLRQERIESFVQGIIGGSAISGVGAGVSSLRESFQAPKTKENATDQTIPGPPDSDAGQQADNDQAQPVPTAGPGQDIEGLKRAEQTAPVQEQQPMDVAPETLALKGPFIERTFLTPFLVQGLNNLGYSLEDIKNLTPEQVHTIISQNIHNAEPAASSAHVQPGPPVSSPAEQRADITAGEGQSVQPVEQEVPVGERVDQATDSATEVEPDILQRIDKLDEYDSGQPDRNRKLKEAMRENPRQAKLAFDLMDFAKKVWGKDLAQSMEEHPMMHVGPFFYADANSLQEWVDMQIQGERNDIERHQKYIDGIKAKKKASKSDQKSIEFTEDSIKSAEKRIEEYRQALSEEKTASDQAPDTQPLDEQYEGGAIDSQQPEQIIDDKPTTNAPEQSKQADTSTVSPGDEGVAEDEGDIQPVPPNNEPFPVGTEVEFEWLGRRMTGTVSHYRHGRVSIKTSENISYPVNPTEVNLPGVTAKKAAPKDAEKTVVYNARRRRPLGLIGDPNSGFMFITDLGDKLVTFFKKQFTSKGFLPKYVFDRWLGAKGDIGQYENQIRFTKADFKKAIKTEYDGKLTDAQITDLNLYLQGKQPTNAIPPETTKMLDVMRAQIDNLSRRFINEGVVSGNLAATFTNNLGLYLNRSYRKFDDPFWSEFVPVQVRNKAEAFIRNNAAAKGQTITDEEVQGLIDYILYDPKAPMAVLSGSKLGSKDLSILKKRGDIAPEIRALMGEYGDPLLNYARSVTKMSSLIAKHHFLNDVKTNGIGKFLFDKPTAKYHVKLAADASKTMAPLNGLYTSQEIAEAFNEFNSQEPLPGWLRVYMKAISTVKANKTVFSVQTHVRNVTGNIGFVVMNGHWRANEAGRATQTAWAHLYDSDQKIRDKYMEYARLGVVQDSAAGGELRQYLKDIRDGRDFFETLGDRSVSKATRKVLDVTQYAYQAEDDMFKIYAFENEYARYRKAYPGKTEEEVKQIAAEIVRNTYPTYSMVPKVIKGLRGNPLVGTFVSFPAEVFRTTYNTMELAAKEMANPETRDIGALRAAGIMTALLLPTAAALFSLHRHGMDKDDDDDLRKFVAPWQKDSEFIYLRNDKDKYTIIDLGYSDPHNYLKRPIYSLLNGDDLMEGGLDAATALARPFLDENMLTERLIDIHRNKKATGDHVYNPDAPVGDRLGAIYAHLWPVTEPGTIASLRRIRKGALGETDKYGKAYSTTSELLSVVTGQKEETKDVTQSLLYRAYELKDRIEATDKDYFRVIKNREATEEQKATAERIRKEATNKIIADAKDIYLSAIRLGVDPKLARRYMILTRNELIFRATAGAK